MSRQAYTISNVKIYTYDGHVIDMDVKGLFQGPRVRIENSLIELIRPAIKDIPVKATFRMTPI